MLEYLLPVLGVLVVLWLCGYAYTVHKLRSIPGFPIDYKMLAVTWPLTAIGMVFLDPGDVMDDFMDELGDMDMEVDSDAEAFEGIENRDVEWDSFDELMEDREE